MFDEVAGPPAARRTCKARLVRAVESQQPYLIDTATV